MIVAEADDAVRCVECGQPFEAHISSATRCLACPCASDAPIDPQRAPEAREAREEPQTRVEACRRTWAAPTHRYTAQGGRAPWRRQAR